MSKINKIRLSGTSYDIQDINATKTVELTEAEYNALPASAKTSNSLFVITDAEAGDLSNYYTKTETDNAITAATSTKQDTLVSGTNIKTINNESILGEGNIDIQGGGGGSSYTAGDGIDINNDVISVTGKVDTSAITTTITSSSTDAQVPSAKAVYDQFSGLKLVKLTQSEYDSLTTKDSQTLYVVTNS